MASGCRSGSIAIIVMGLVRFANGRVVRGDVLVRGDVWSLDGVVVCPEALYWRAASSDALAHDVVDCEGCIVAPGLVDIQTNGCFGVDFASPRVEERDVRRAAAAVLRHGCTALAPTLVSSSRELYRTLIPRYAAWTKAPPAGGAAILGLHLEGPFLNEAKKGAHLAENIPSSCAVGEMAERYGSLDGVVVVTLAPELPGAPAAIADLAKRGVAVSLGHSQATKAQGVAGVRAGASLLTHLYNAMPAFHHRDPGLVGLLGLAEHDRRPYYSIIADGIHADPASVAIARRAHPGGAVLVTDAMAAMGLGDGDHTLGDDVQVTVRGLRATVRGTDTLAGAVVSLDECVRRFAEFTNCGPAAALNAASAHPAAVLGDATRGSLDVGRRADVALFDDDLRPVATYVAGAKAWGRDEAIKSP